VSEPRYWAVVPAAGVGRRMGADRPKQYLPLAGDTVLGQTLRRLTAEPRIATVVVAISPHDPYWPTAAPTLSVPLLSVTGGVERCHSVLAALHRLQPLAAADDWVLVHDAARPCLRLSALQRLIDTLRDDPVGGLLAQPIRDTVKRADAQQRIVETLDRTTLWRAQTPQMFRYAALQQALQQAIAADQWVTDEAAALERQGAQPRLVEGDSDNLKITEPADLLLAERYLQQCD